MQLLGGTPGGDELVTDAAEINPERIRLGPSGLCEPLGAREIGKAPIQRGILRRQEPRELPSADPVDDPGPEPIVGRPNLAGRSLIPGRGD